MHLCRISQGIGLPMYIIYIYICVYIYIYSIYTEKYWHCDGLRWTCCFCLLFGRFPEWLWEASKGISSTLVLVLLRWLCPTRPGMPSSSSKDVDVAKHLFQNAYNGKLTRRSPWDNSSLLERRPDLLFFRTTLTTLTKIAWEHDEEPGEEPGPWFLFDQLWALYVSKNGTIQW